MKKHLLILLLIPFWTAQAAAQTPDTLRLSVQDCIDLALKNNLELKNSQLEIDKAQAVKKEAWTLYFPSVSAQALAFDAKEPLLTLGIDDIPNALVRQTLYNLYAQYGLQLGLDKEYSWAQHGAVFNVLATEPVFAGGRIFHGNQLAKLSIQAAEYQSLIKEDEIKLQTEVLYWQLVSLEEKIATLDQLDQLLDTLEKDLAGAVEAGLAMPTDQFKVTLKKNESQLNRKKVDDGLILLKMALAQHLGIEDWQTLTLTDTLGVETDPTAYFHDAHEAVTLRPESQLLDLSVKAETLKKKMTLGEALPSLMLGGSANYHTILENTRPNFIAFALLQVPLTDWHKTAYKLKQHHIEMEEAENTRLDLTGKMQLQTSQAWFNLEQSYLRVQMAQTAVNDAEANLKMESDYYEAGLIALSELLEAQTLLKHSRDELTDSRVEYRINLVTYKQLTHF